MVLSHGSGEVAAALPLPPLPHPPPPLHLHPQPHPLPTQHTEGLRFPQEGRVERDKNRQ